MGRSRVYASDSERRKAQTARRSAARNIHTVSFTGVDGEGVGTGRNHRYVLLGVGSEHIINEEGLRFPEIAEFLYECYLANPSDVYAGFFLGYDFTQWLKTLPENRAKILLTDEGQAIRQRRIGGHSPFPVRYEGWEFDILGTKRFKLRPEGKNSWMYVNDSGPFFQCSFLSAINPASWDTPVCSDAEYELVRQGKLRRSDAELDSDMIKYNALENEIFSRLMSRVNEGMVKAGIKLRRNQWFGPGQAAQSWMSNNKIISSTTLGRVPNMQLILEKARRTYYAGWFELFAHGHIPNVSYEYDVNSAYPFIAAKLPCLEHGSWRETTKAPLDLDTYSIVHARVSGSDRHIGAMLHRMDDGNIRRPQRTQGWYWSRELQAAIRCNVIDEVEVLEAWTYEPCSCRPPMRGLVGLYQERQKVGKDTAYGKSLKLIYNSTYGKFAQSVGSPKFGNPIYASLITSGCRTMILNAIASHPKGTSGVVMVATDGVYFTSPHPSLTLSDQIGDWSMSEHHNLTLFKPGVYWSDKARAAVAAGKSATFKARGISAVDFASSIATVDAHYSRWPKEYPPEQDPMSDREGWHPLVKFDTAFSMITCTQALAWGRWYLAGTLGHANPVPAVCDSCSGAHLVQDADPIGKRHSGWYENGIYWSSPYKDGGLCPISVPYSRRFGQPDPDVFGMSDDGTVLENFSWILHDRA